MRYTEESSSRVKRTVSLNSKFTEHYHVSTSPLLTEGLGPLNAGLMPNEVISDSIVRFTSRRF